MSHSVGHHAKQAVRKLNAEGKRFLDNHPLFGSESAMPLTAQRLRDLAQQVTDGLITEDEADEFARVAAVSEYGKLDEVNRQIVDLHMAEGYASATA